jgi:hypothetical protein
MQFLLIPHVQECHLLPFKSVTAGDEMSHFGEGVDNDPNCVASPLPWAIPSIVMRSGVLPSEEGGFSQLKCDAFSFFLELNLLL